MKIFEILFDTNDQKDAVAPSFETVKDCKKYIKSELGHYLTDAKNIRIMDGDKIVYKEEF